MKASKDELSLNITEHVHWLKDVINKYLMTGKFLSADFSELPYLACDDLKVLPDDRRVTKLFKSPDPTLNS